MLPDGVHLFARILSPATRKDAAPMTRLSIRYRAVLMGLAAMLLPTVSFPARAEEAAKPGGPASAPIAPIRWKDMNGSAYDLALTATRKATVFLFVSTQCPIANLYTPRI